MAIIAVVVRFRFRVVIVLVLEIPSCATLKRTNELPGVEKSLRCLKILGSGVLGWKSRCC